jgi:uncharacterized cupin superfamily protein
VKRFNFLDAELQVDDDDPPAFRSAWASIGTTLGSEHLAGSLIEVQPGNKAMTYHWEAAQEEWLIVLEGTGTLRTPEGEQELRAGDLVAFPTGPTGAHQLINNSDSACRFIMLSDQAETNVIVYPDSNKVGVRYPDLHPNYVMGTDVDYWEGET